MCASVVVAVSALWSECALEATYLVPQYGATYLVPQYGAAESLPSALMEAEVAQPETFH